MISKVIIGSLLVAFVTAQRCDQGDTVCTKLESDDPIFQGQRCEVPGDCKDPYNPYCSKWGYCISYNLFGEEGPGQSKGAVEDGTRGQCRTDSDCTDWAPTCSPLGYCRGSDPDWDHDGSFGSPTNPKPGGPQSDWVKNNAKSGGDRNTEYYGTVEDDNRKAHVKFRKENPIFYEQVPVLLPRLEQIEKTVYEPCTYCNYDPKSDGEYQDLVSRLGGGSGNSNGARRKTQQTQNQPGSSPRTHRAQNANGARRKNQQIQNANGARRKNQQTQNANGARRKNQQTQNSNGPRRKNQQSQNSNGARRKNQQPQNSNGCPGGSLDKCVEVCPSISTRVFGACIAGCSKRCT